MIDLKSRIENSIDHIYDHAQDSYAKNKCAISGLSIKHGENTISSLDCTNMMYSFKSISGWFIPDFDMSFDQITATLDGSKGIKLSNSCTLNFHDIGNEYATLVKEHKDTFVYDGKPKNGGPLKIDFDLEIFRPTTNNAENISYSLEYVVKFESGRIKSISTRSVDTSARGSGLETYSLDCIFKTVKIKDK